MKYMVTYSMTNERTGGMGFGRVFFAPAEPNAKISEEDVLEIEYHLREGNPDYTFAVQGIFELES